MAVAGVRGISNDGQPHRLAVEPQLMPSAGERVQVHHRHTGMFSRPIRSTVTTVSAFFPPPTPQQRPVAAAACGSHSSVHWTAPWVTLSTTEIRGGGERKFIIMKESGPTGPMVDVTVADVHVGRADSDEMNTSASYIFFISLD
eukprot:Selendium_serpulae@DN6468_c0_g1_i11.p3